MEIKQRKYEKNTIGTEQIKLEEYIESNRNFIYYILSEEVETKGRSETLSIYCNIFFKEKEIDNSKKEEKENENSSENNLTFDIEDDTKLNIPKRTHALEFSSGEDEVFKKEEKDEMEEDKEIDNIDYVAQISFFIHIEGVMYEIENYSLDIPLKEFSQLYEVFNNKQSLIQEEFLPLVSNSVKLENTDVTQDDLKDIFKKGNIDLSIDEIYNNLNEIYIDKISINHNHIMFLLKRFEGNQAIYYLTEDEKDRNINKDIQYSVNILTDNSTTLKQFQETFIL